MNAIRFGRITADDVEVGVFLAKGLDHFGVEFDPEIRFPVGDDLLKVLCDRSGPDAEFDLRLLGRRQLRSNNSWLHNLPRMTSGQNRCNALLNSDDAAQRGLADGDLLLVTSKVGKIQVPLRIDDGIRPGSVVIPHGWGHQATGWQHASTLPGENVNDLHDPAQVDPFTGTAAVNDTWVKVSRAD